MKKQKELTMDDLKEVLDLLYNPIDISSEEYKCFTKSEYIKIIYIFQKCKALFPRFETLLEISKEHKILKQFIIDEGLYEKLLNSDKFIEWLKEDPELVDEDIKKDAADISKHLYEGEAVCGNKTPTWPDDPKPVERNINFS